MFMSVFRNNYRNLARMKVAFAMVLSVVLCFTGCHQGRSDTSGDTEPVYSPQTIEADKGSAASDDKEAGASAEDSANGSASADGMTDENGSVSEISGEDGGDGDLSQTAEAMPEDMDSGDQKVYIKDVAYSGDDKTRTMDIMYEKDGTIKPVLLLVHGGSYISGDKSNMAPYQHYYYKKYLTVSINYPLLPQTTMVSQYRCVEQALAFLSEHAEDLDADMSKVVVLGFSAGAQLAVRACEEIALRASNGEELPYTVVGVVDNAGPTDDKTLAETTTSELLQLALAYPEVIDGVKDSSLATELKKIDCSTNIVRGMPPVLIIQGTNDDKVDYKVSVAFYEALKEQDIDVTFKLFEDQPHGVDLTLVIPCVDEFLENASGL